MTTTDARHDALGEATLGEFAQALRGELVRPEDPSYDEARSIWNAAHDKRPAVVVRCRGVADVLRGVEFARSEGLPLAIRGGGRSIPGFSTSDGGLVLDLSAMNAVRVDPDRRRIVAQAGCLWQDVDAEAQAFGLAVTGGLVSTTGIAGFTLGGGIGWLVRRCGLTCDNLVGADIVTADGPDLHTSEDEHPDLLWALRGGGGNFGVVTSFEFWAHEVGPTVFAGIVFYRGEEAARVLRGFGQAAANAPDELSLAINMTTAPPLPFLPEEIHGKPVVAVLGVWSGRPEDGDAATRPFRGLAPVVADLFGPMPYVAMQTLIDPLYPRGMWNYFRSAFFTDLGDTAVDALVSSYSRAPNAISELHVHHLGGAMGRVPADATAFGTRDSEYILNVVARTPDAEGFGGVVQWARSASAALGPDAASYVNFTGEASEEHVRASYPPATYARLTAVKGRYDPTNLFRLNQNIPPSSLGIGNHDNHSAAIVNRPARTWGHHAMRPDHEKSRHALVAATRLAILRGQQARNREGEARMGMRLAHRLVTTGIATVAAVALAAGPANAHFCFKTNLNERAAQGVAGSANWVSFHDLAFEFTGLCDAGIEVLAEAGGATPDTLINSHGTMAGGTLRKGEDAGTPSISHLDFEAIDAAFPAAAAACGG